MIRIELRQPARIQDTIARPQSLALLLLIWLRRREYANSTRQASLPASVTRTSGVVTAMELAQLFPEAMHLRMIISRAFADFAAWGIEVGWGEDQNASCALLNTRNRNRGPFWLSQRAFEALEIFSADKRAELSDVYAFLKLPSATTHAGPKITHTDAAAADFWREFAIAKREQLDGHLIVDAQRGALAG